MTFDATVTFGDLLTMGAGAFALLSLVVWSVGGRYFPTKGNLKVLRDHVDAQVSMTRQDVQSAVGRMEVLITNQGKILSDQAHERHAQSQVDMARLEVTIEAAASDAREARDTAKDARWQADTAKEMVEKVERTLDQGISRMEALLQGLMNRARTGDGTR